LATGGNFTGKDPGSSAFKPIPPLVNSVSTAVNRPIAAFRQVIEQYNPMGISGGRRDLG
jgi:hypothetical protein